MTDHSQAGINNNAEPELWVDQYGNYMYRYALSRVPDPETAQELVQETFVAALQAYKNFQGRSSVKTWLIAILKRKIVDFFRRRKHQHTTEDIESVANAVENMFDETGHWRAFPSEWTVNPGAAYEQKEFIDILYQCLSGLPKRLANIFMMREFEGRSTEEICKEMDISESNSWVMIYRARMKLRDCLEALWINAPASKVA